MVRWDDDRLATEDSVAIGKAPSGAGLRDNYADTVRTLTLGLVALRDNALVLGPLELLRFGPPKVTSHAVEWPIEGGLLSRKPGGTWRIEATDGTVRARLWGWVPALPKPIYRLTHLHVHLLFTRLYLLRLHGREPALGQIPTPADRLKAAAVDVAFCFTLAGLSGRRRPRRALLIAAVYHVACWSIFGRTLGGLVTRQRVVAVDGSRVTPEQSMLRFAFLPVSWITRRPLHDDVASTEVISD